LAQFSIANYTPPGPVAAAFIASTKLVTAIQGPIGSGKTTSAFFKALRYTASFPPCLDGIIRAKGAVVRQDYRTLYSTTLESWFKWFPRETHKDYTGGQDRPATHVVKFVTPRGKRIILKVEFKALGAQRIEAIMRGWEGSWIYLNEVDTQDEDSLDFGIQRTWRYPALDLFDMNDPAAKSFSWLTDKETGERMLPYCVIADLNAPPDPDHWICKRIIDNPEANTPEGDIGYFRQPGGLDPDAENRARSPRVVYERLAKTMDRYQVHRMIHNKVGYDRSGLPVFEEVNPDIHFVDVEPDPSLELHLGLDISGLHPAVVGVQRKGLQYRAIFELYIGRTHPEVFGEHLAATLTEFFPTYRIGASYYDPSNDYGADREGGYLSSIDAIRLSCFRRGEGPLIAAPSNEIPLRLAAIRNPLIRPPVLIANGITGPGLVINAKRCPMLAKGLVGHYRYQLTPQGGLVNPANPKPIKNEYANVVDSLEYVLLGMEGVAGAVRQAAQGARPGDFAASAANGVLKSDFAL
jgi:hypothetical protein